MKRIVTIDGNEACSNTAYMFTEVAGIYPITPSSSMAEQADEWSNQGRKNIFNDTVKVVEMQSEAGAAGMVHGSLQSGCLTTTYTASQGLLLMIPNMYKIAGEMLPCVFHVSARSLSTHALSIFGDHQDIYACRQTGFAMIASSSVQDASLLSGVAHLSAIKASLPFMHFFDGFRTSHEINKVIALEEEEYKKLIDYEALSRFRKKALNPLHPVTRGTAENDDIYFQATEVRNVFHNKIPDIVNDYMEEINKLAGTNYQPFNYYGSDSAEDIIVAMGSVCETIKQTIDELNNNGYNVGLIEVHLYRPFSEKFFTNVLPESVKRIAVLDRTKEQGSVGEPLYLDVTAILKNQNIEIFGGRFGLSSKDTNPSQIKAIYDMLKTSPRHNFTIGINDDVTNLSLPLENFKIKTGDEFLIYGYGSDGMVSASKSIIKLIGNYTDMYAQGYFQYDSKKSGGVTIGHLRFDNKPIRATYYVDSPRLVVCTKETYLDDFDILSGIAENGIFILNTEKTQEELESFLTKEVKEIIVERKLKFYTIDAYKLSSTLGLGRKISTIFESAILYITNVLDYSMAVEKMKEHAKEAFGKHGEKVLEANYKAIEEAKDYLNEITLTSTESEKHIKELTDNYSKINGRRGNSLPTSAFLNTADGTFESGTSARDKRMISPDVPVLIEENCIMCNQCSLVCPHGVIRSQLLSSEEYNNAPDFVKARCQEPINPALKEYKFLLSFSAKDCTGCGVCVKECPGKQGNKALEFQTLNQALEKKEQEIYEYIEENVKDKGIKVTNILTSQFKDAKFKFSGACAGCGETPYLKLATQLFGDHMIIANATGCTSIYGGSAPCMPYTVPWASSLFEDNAEYGFGMVIANAKIKDRIKNIMEENMDNPNKELFERWIANYNDYDITKEVYDNLDYKTVPAELCELKDYILKRSIWAIGGDGWAYDIGFGGIDHVVASNENINILILDSQVYSNTGGQSSKSSPKGTIAAFTSSGKNQSKKDLARVLMAYPHVYVAQVSLGSNQAQLLKAMQEAERYNGPSVIIAYSPCIAHGIKAGMSDSIEQMRLATQSGYFPIFRYNPETEIFTLDSKNVNFDLYEEFLNTQTRYSNLKKINPEFADYLLNANKEEAIKRYEFYKSLVKEQE